MKHVCVRLFTVAVISCGLASAKKPAPLPDFTVLAPDGTSVKSAQLKLPNQWLLVYVQPNAASSDTILNSLNDGKLNSLNNKILLIIGGVQPSDASAMLAGFPFLKSITYYADPKRNAQHAMGLPGIPAVLGMKQNVVQWRFVGAMPKPEHTRSLLKNWREK